MAHAIMFSNIAGSNYLVPHDGIMLMKEFLLRCLRADQGPNQGIDTEETAARKLTFHPVGLRDCDATQVNDLLLQISVMDDLAGLHDGPGGETLAALRDLRENVGGASCGGDANDDDDELDQELECG